MIDANTAAVMLWCLLQVAARTGDGWDNADVDWDNDWDLM